MGLARSEEAAPRSRRQSRAPELVARIVELCLVDLHVAHDSPGPSRPNLAGLLHSHHLPQRRCRQEESRARPATIEEIVRVSPPALPRRRVATTRAARADSGQGLPAPYRVPYHWTREDRLLTHSFAATISPRSRPHSRRRSQSRPHASLRVVGRGLSRAFCPDSPSSKLRVRD